MVPNKIIDHFLSNYNTDVIDTASELRHLILSVLPAVIEQLDLPAKMIGYCYGQKYSELICMLIPSKKGVKLSFNQALKLEDPNALLKGNGKITRYVEINGKEKIDKKAIEALLKEGLKAYKERMKTMGRKI